MKKIIRGALQGVSIACIIHVLTSLVIDCMNGGNYATSDWGTTKMSIGTIIIGLGFGLPSAVYDCENLSFPAKAGIHLGIGYTVLILTSLALGWFPIRYGIFAVLGMLSISLIIWAGFFVYYQWEAKSINRKLKGK